MRIQYDLKFTDVLLFQAFHQFLSPAVQGFYLLGAWFFWHAESSAGSPASDAAFMAIAAYALMWTVQLAFNALYLMSRKNGNVITRHAIELQLDGLAEETQLTRTFVQWAGIAKVVTRPGFVAVYISSQLAHVIPNRAFASSSERDAFLTAIRQSGRAV